MEYLVDNGTLQAKSPGLGYRFSKKLEDKDRAAMAKWGSIVKGVDHGDGWLKVTYGEGERFLPFQANGVVVLTRKEAASPIPPVEAADTPKKPPAPELPAGSPSSAPVGVSPSGNSCKSSPAGGGAAGYVFMCGKETEQECASLCMLGAAQFELAKMKRFITRDTRIFLFNHETLTLTGGFGPVGEPERELVPGAFGGKFPAHLRIAPLEVPLRSATLERRVMAGPKSGQELEALSAQLAAGEEAGEPWTAAAGSGQPAAKRPRVEGPADGAPAAEPPAPTAGAAAAAGSTDSPPDVLLRKAKSSPVLPPSSSAGGSLQQKAKSAPAVASSAPKAVQPSVGDGANGAVAAGYVFLCSKATLQECQTKCLLGSPQWELGRMKKCIAPMTQLFLYNFDSQMLLGPFTPLGAPERDLEQGAFGGRFNAQVRVAPAWDELRAAKLPTRLSAGSKLAAEVDTFIAKLQEGEVLPADVQDAWRASKTSEPPAKRARVVEPKVPAAKAPAPKAPEAAKAVPPVAKVPQPAKVAPTSKAPQPAKVAGPPAKGVMVRAPLGPTLGAAQGAAVQAVKPMPSLPGYIFMCGRGTYDECEANRLFGSPLKELGQMKRFITPTTKLFLFNFDGSQLLGPFLALGEPQKDLVPGLFGGKYQAHVAVAPLEAPLREAKISWRVSAGPKSQSEVASMLNLLQKGKDVSAKVQDAWGPPAEVLPEDTGSEEPTAPIAAVREAPPPAAAVAPAPAGERSLPLGSGALEGLSEEARTDFQADMSTLAETFGVSAELSIPEDAADEARVLLRGAPASVRKAEEELQGVLQFYGVAPVQS